MPEKDPDTFSCSFSCSGVFLAGSLDDGFDHEMSGLAAQRRVAPVQRSSSGAEPGIPQVTEGPRAGQPRRQILRVKDKRVVGFPVIVSSLTPDESIRLEGFGLGGRGKMGCGFFGARRE